MLNPSAILSLVWRNLGRLGCCVLLMGLAIGLAEKAMPHGKPGLDLTEQEALKVLNDSPWAHTIRPTIQDTPCSYKNSAFPNLFPEDKAAAYDAEAPVVPTEVVKPDSSEYLIRFQSAKPVQMAIQSLLAMDEKWSVYGAEVHFASKDDGPTDLPNARYNEFDMITIAVILRHAGPDGTSLFDYGFKHNRNISPSDSLRIWPCAGLRTSNGQTYARLIPANIFQGHGKFRSLQFSFPILIDGKRLISNPREKIEFRLVVNQRVFETSFDVNFSDLPDGSETRLYLPAAFTDLTEIAQQ